MKFKDAKGREWNVKLNFRNLCQIEDETAWKVMEQPLQAPASFREWGVVAGVLLQDQIEKYGIDADDFAEGFIGETFQEFINAVLVELAAFFKAPRPDVALVLEKGLELQNQLVQENAKILQQGCEAASSKLLELLELNPGALHSGNSSA